MPPKKNQFKVSEINSKLSELREKYKDQAFGRAGKDAFSTAVQEQILRELCGELDLAYKWDFPSEPMIDCLSHSVSVCIEVRSTDEKHLYARGMGLSTRYSWEYPEMAKGAATELALTIAKGKALSDLGIVPPSSTSLGSKEEYESWERVNTSSIHPNMNLVALTFSRLDKDTKFLARRQGLDIIDFVEVFDPKKDDVDSMREMITSGAIAEKKRENS